MAHLLARHGPGQQPGQAPGPVSAAIPGVGALDPGQIPNANWQGSGVVTAQNPFGQGGVAAGSAGTKVTDPSGGPDATQLAYGNKILGSAGT